MRILFLLSFVLLAATNGLCQLEMSTGYAINKPRADGLPLHIGYDFKLANRFYTKFQAGYKYLDGFNDYVEAKVRTVSFELHQTLSYEVVRKRKYILKPNIGIHYKWYDWELVMVPPLSTGVGRAWVLSVGSDTTLVLTSTPQGYYERYKANRFGYTFQLQNQFLIKDRLWIHITPFIEPTYDRAQNTGGCYVGVIFK